MDFEQIFQEAWTLRNDNHTKEALALANSAFEQAENSNEIEGQALMLKVIAQVQQDQGDLGLALKTYKKIEPLYIQLKKTPEQMHTLRHIGSLFLELGKAECAERCLVQVAENYENSDTNPLEKANAFRVYALSLEERDKPQEAKQYWSKAKKAYEKVGLEEGINECDSHLH